ncbi:MAG: alpha-amylase/4-alpha-glucanotransferase domain-containing protein [Sulfuricurvum sp.]
MAKTSLLFGIHMHQPVDNFRWVIDHAVEVCYKPFFEVASQYPQFRFSLHCSGWLMEQIAQFHPEVYALIKTLVEGGSIELFGAGYYEPILSTIPSRDRIAQIERLNKSIRSGFSQTPKGVWLTERVWESSLIRDLYRCGIEYTVMDDYHFQCAGFDEAVLDGYYMSEEGGEKLGLFPISKKLRYALPFLNVNKAIEAITSYCRENDSAAIIFDDAEKFGMWPGTYEWVYEKGWLVRFIEAVLADPSIEPMHYGEYFRTRRPRGIAYLPNTSYYEMGEWSLRADDALKLEEFKQEMGHQRYEEEGVKFLKGGIWKNFFVKYPESNRLHKRMLELSAQRETVGEGEFDINLYKLQTNDPLWHGVFGGLYLPNLRDNAYRYLIRCEDIRYRGKQVVVSDQNELDGYDKVKIVMPKVIFRFDAAYGGQMVEFDSRQECFNWQNTLTRRKEAYHRQILEGGKTQEARAVEDGIDTIHNMAVEIDDSIRETVIYDWYLKNSFIDHISDGSFDLQRFKRCDFREYGDFANQPFEAGYTQEKVTFSRDGGLYFPEKAFARLEKHYIPSVEGIGFEITFSTDDERTLNYVLEHNFHFADYKALRINGADAEEEGMSVQTDRLEIIDGYLNKRLLLRFSQPCDIYYFSLKTLSQSEKGFDLSTQGISFAAVFAFSKTISIRGELEVFDV